MGKGDGSPRMAVTTCRQESLLSVFVRREKGRAMLLKWSGQVKKINGRRDMRCGTVNSQRCQLNLKLSAFREARICA